MSKLPEISIIIPVYNVERYIADCLNSVIKNSEHFEEGDIEIILVNDGSSDKSGEIAAYFSRKFNFINLYSQENQGLSAARNTGLTKAQGKYIFFLDSDDTIADDALFVLYTFAEKNECDVCQCGMLYSFGDSRDYVAADTNGFDKPCVLSSIEAMSFFIDNEKIKSFACGKLYKSTLIKNRPFLIGRFFEDIYWQPMVIGACVRYGVINKPYYNYRQRSESITGTFSFRKLDLLTGYLVLLEYVKLNYPQLYHKTVRKYWTIKTSFDNSLKLYECKTDDLQRSRLDSINKESDFLFQTELSNDISYLLYTHLPHIFRIGIKIRNALIKTKRLIKR